MFRSDVNVKPQRFAIKRSRSIILENILFETNWNSDEPFEEDTSASNKQLDPI